MLQTVQALIDEFVDELSDVGFWAIVALIVLAFFSTNMGIFYWWQGRELKQDKKDDEI